MLTRREVVYHQNMWSEPLSDLNGRFRDVSSRFFRDNPEQTIRLQEFIYREILVLAILQNNETDVQLNVLRILNESIESVMSLVIRLISVYEIMGGEIADTLQPYIGRYALQFCHELYNFANCPYDGIDDYDRNTNYSGGIFNLPISEQLAISDQLRNATWILINIETTVPDSEYEENIEIDARRTPPEVIALDSSSDESDVEITGVMSHPIETYESPSAGPPFASTGIRYSVEQPANPTTRYFSSGGTRIVESSDEESTSDEQTVSRWVCRKRKKQVETNKNKRMKKSTIVGGRLYSESSSSDDEDV